MQRILKIEDAVTPDEDSDLDPNLNPDLPGSRIIRRRFGLRVHNFFLDSRSSMEEKNFIRALVFVFLKPQGCAGKTTQADPKPQSR